MDYEFAVDAFQKSDRRIRHWYHTHLLNALRAAKEKRVKEIDASIALAEELIKSLDEPLPKPKPAPYFECKLSDEPNEMMPLTPKELDLLYGSTEKGAAERYFKERHKKAPEDKFFARLCTSWDYGWQQKQAKQNARDCNFGRCFVMKHTLYRNNNLAPDPPHYSYPSAEISTCL